MSCGCGCNKDESIEAEAEYKVCSSCESKSYCAENETCKAKTESASQTCGIGEELIDGECRKVAVTLDLEIGEAEALSLIHI